MTAQIFYHGTITEKHNNQSLTSVKIKITDLNLKQWAYFSLVCHYWHQTQAVAQAVDTRRCGSGKSEERLAVSTQLHQSQFSSVIKNTPKSLGLWGPKKTQELCPKNWVKEGKISMLILEVHFGIRRLRHHIIIYSALKKRIVKMIITIKICFVC